MIEGSPPALGAATLGASIAVHTYGDFLNFNPNAHAIVPDSCYLGDGDFQMVLMITGKNLSEAFRREVLTMLKKEGKITGTVNENMMLWHYTCISTNGFDRKISKGWKISVPPFGITTHRPRPGAKNDMYHPCGGRHGHDVQLGCLN